MNLAVYQGLMRMIAAMLQPLNVVVNTAVMNSKGIFGVTMMLPIYCIIYNIANAVSSDLWTVVFGRCDFLLIFTVLQLTYECFASVLRLISVCFDDQRILYEHVRQQLRIWPRAVVRGSGGC